MSKKFIWTAVTLSITILLCIAVITIANKGRSSVNNTMGQYDKLISSYSDMKYSIYENSRVSGSELVSLIRDVSQEDAISIIVKNGSGTEKTYTYSSVKNAGSTVLEDIADRSKTEFYINPTANFTSKVVKDSNDIITSLKFEQEK